MEAAAWISLVTATAALGGVIAVYRQVLEIRRQTQADRNIAIETRLADWHAAFQFYDIDLDQTSNELGLSKDESAQLIAYLVLVTNSLTVLCHSRRDPYDKSTDGLVFQALSGSAPQFAYWREIFSRSVTRKVWKQAKNCISPRWRNQIDAFLAQSPEKLVAGISSSST